jgi:hypothetical protein
LKLELLIADGEIAYTPALVAEQAVLFLTFHQTDGEPRVRRSSELFVVGVEGN